MQVRRRCGFVYFCPDGLRLFRTFPMRLITHRTASPSNFFGFASLFATVIAIVFVLCTPSVQAAEGPSAAPGSFIGMGAATGTPSGDIRAAIEPRLRTLREPASIRSVIIPLDDMMHAQELAQDLNASPRNPIRIGIDYALGDSAYTKWLAYTIAQIKHAFGPKNVEILWLEERSLVQGLRTRQLDFFIMDSDRYALAQSNEPAEQLATFQPVAATSAQDAQATVVFARVGHTWSVPEGDRPLALLRAQAGNEPLLGARIAAVDDERLSSWLALAGEARRFGVTPKELQDETTFFEHAPEAVLNAVLSGTHDVGVLPSCVLESFERQGRVDIASDLRIIGERKGDGLACVHSSNAYPGWVFGTLPEVAAPKKKAMSTLLYAMRAKSYGGEWQLPTLNRSLYDLFYALKIGPYEHLATWSFNRFMRENAEAIALLTMLAFLVVFYAVSLSVLVRRKTRELREALEARDLMEAEATQSRQHIANLERTGIVGQMSTIIAHELKQPLSAIMNYANGLHRRVDNDRFDKESFTFALGEISAEAERASRIVERVRAYAKHDYPPRKVCDLNEVIGNSITTFRRSRQTNAQIAVRVNPRSMAEVDAWEIELAVLNLLKNAADAISGVSDPSIEVTLVPLDADTWSLIVADNGPEISDEAIANFFKPLQTSKGANGMGLGLSIVASIAERHAGHIVAEKNGRRGVRFVFTFPRVHDPDEKMDELLVPPRLRVYGEAKAPEQPLRARRGVSAVDEGQPVTIHSKGLSDVVRRMEKGGFEEDECREEEAKAKSKTDAANIPNH